MPGGGDARWWVTVDPHLSHNVWETPHKYSLIFPEKLVLSTQSSPYASLLSPLVISSNTLAFIVNFM